MRSKSIIILLLFAFVFVMADNSLLFQKRRTKTKNKESITLPDSLKNGKTDSLKNIGAVNDTTKMDSLQLAIYHHNKAIDDSIRLDSINRKKSNGIDAPVKYAAEDSLVYDAKGKVAHLYGNSTVQYEKMDLKSEKIYMNLDSSIVHATGVTDTAKNAKSPLRGTPVFKMGQDSYESDTMAFNFKTKKGLINNVTTQQEDGYLRSELSKRNNNGDIYLQHGRYTTCDKSHPDFYIALSRAKVRPL